MNYPDRRIESLKKALSKGVANALNSYMSELSETYSCAGWLIGLEYQLWDAVTGGETGGNKYLPEEIETLKELSAIAGGWWMWMEADDGENAWECGEIFLTLEEWEAHLATNPSDWVWYKNRRGKE